MAKNDATLLKQENEKLSEQIESLTRSCEELLMENTTLASFIQRNEESSQESPLPNEHSSQTPLGDLHSKIPPSNALAANFSQDPQNKASNDFTSKIPPITHLDMNGLYYISLLEIDTLSHEIDRTKNIASQNINVLKILLEQNSIRINEIRLESSSLKRDILLSSTKKNNAENFLQWWETKLIEKDSLITKLSSKNNILKANIRKSKNILNSYTNGTGNGGMGGGGNGSMVTNVDHHKLQLENSIQVEKINELTNVVLKLKLNLNDSYNNLRGLLSELNSLAAEEKNLQKIISQRQGSLVNSESDIVQSQNVLNQMRKNLSTIRIKTKTNNNNVSIIDAVRLNQSIIQLRAEVNNWKRKNQIIQLAYQGVQKKVRKEKKTAEL